ncbi:MAG: hypothetical protein RMI89_06710 [Gloeomargarita sp. SKYBB_i_bin120]|nr:hypothetical protein [Gloeomargarita sp. SKYG98]MCS7292651.1 hypothetical protein [Gloeomargarita sp. SKYB120]MDW8178213.1 hypothetical protein [Gloeomargarita sp. SKYBB_i_bin120]
MRALTVTMGLFLATLTLTPTLPTLAQTNRFQEIMNLKRAQNLARMAGERANGGIEVYRTEPAMHRTVGTVGEARYEDVGDAWVFTFRGGTPEEVAAGRYSIRTVVRVDKRTFQTSILSNERI